MKVEWAGYEFIVYKPPVRWYEVAGLYIFTYSAIDRLGISVWHPLYVGETHSLAERLPNHEKWLEALTLGATHIHVRVESDEVQRVFAERAVIQHYQPPLNVQHR